LASISRYFFLVFFFEVNIAEINLDNEAKAIKAKYLATTLEEELQEKNQITVSQKTHLFPSIFNVMDEVFYFSFRTDLVNGLLIQLHPQLHFWLRIEQN